MARTTKPLTNTEIQHAKPRDKEYSLMDGGGLKLRIKPNGSKLWVFSYYRPHSKQRANISFGTFPEVSLSEVRTRGKESRELMIFSKSSYGRKVDKMKWGSDEGREARNRKG